MSNRASTNGGFRKRKERERNEQEDQDNNMDGGENDTEDNSNDESDSPGKNSLTHEEVQQKVNQFVRIALTSTCQQRLIKRTEFIEALGKDYTSNFETVFKKANKRLGNVFAYELVKLKKS